MKKIGFYIHQYSFTGFLKLVIVVLIARINDLFSKDIYESWKTFDLVYLNKLSSKRLGDKNILSWNLKGKPIEVQLRRSTSDFAVFNQVIIDEEYSPLISLAVQNKIDVKTIVDLGANIGLTSVYLSVNYPRAVIHALEPHPNNYKILQSNIDNNSLSNIKTHNNAIWHSNESVFIDTDFADQREWAARVSNQNKGFETDAVTLSDFCTNQQIGFVDILKMDIEGAEVQILRHDLLLGAFLQDHVRLVAMELHGTNDDRQFVISQLINASFECYYFGESVFGVNRNLCKPL